MASHRIGYRARVSANLGLDRWQLPTVSLRTNEDKDWDVQMTPSEARSIARQLKRAADFVDPPTPRKVKA